MECKLFYFLEYIDYQRAFESNTFLVSTLKFHNAYLIFKKHKRLVYYFTFKITERLMGVQMLSPDIHLS